MVKTTYPAQWKYINKWSILAFSLFAFIPLHWSVYNAHFSWKRGHLPRLKYMDLRYNKFIGQRGMRDKLLQTPALEAYPDTNNRMFTKQIKPFLRAHAP